MRTVVYVSLFCISLIVMCATIYSLNWAFWISLAVFALSCFLMHRDERYCQGDIIEMFGKGHDFE